MLAVLYSGFVYCQSGDSYIFNKVTPQDFIIKASPVVDSNANAVIIADIGSASFIGNKYHYFSYVFKKHVRIRINNASAFDLSTVSIHLYGKDKTKDELSNLEAVTYNLQGDKLVTTPLAAADIFEDKVSRTRRIARFTLPAVKAGSIIEYSYTITSFHAWDLPGWTFQHIGAPCLYSEYKVVFPNALRFLSVRHGIDSFSLFKTTPVKNNRYIMGDMTVVSNDVMGWWAMKDVPAFRTEEFVESPVDYLDKIEFFVTEAYNGESVEDIGNTWKSVTADLLLDDNFGGAIEYRNSMNLLNTADQIISGEKDPTGIARQLFYYVRDKFTCIPDNDIFIHDQLFDINKKKKGNVAALNLLLIALMRQKGLLADPVILSTVDYGKNIPDYPVIDKMNYVICMIRLGTDTVYLDASQPDLAFGKLSINCYNGHARIISNEGGPVYFLPEKVKEQKSTTVIIFNQEKGVMGASVKTENEFFGSEKLRQRIKISGQGELVATLKSNLTAETNILNFGIDSLTKPDYPTTMHFDFKMPMDQETIYFNPVVISEYNKNPFASDQRKYPVTLPYPIDNMYVLNMEIPDGYIIEELPKSCKVSYNEDEGSFEYRIEHDQSRIQFRSHIILNRTNVPAEDYNSLRDFFEFVKKKYNEQIVFKLKK